MSIKRPRLDRNTASEFATGGETLCRIGRTRTLLPDDIPDLRYIGYLCLSAADANQHQPRSERESTLCHEFSIAGSVLARIAISGVISDSDIAYLRYLSPLLLQVADAAERVPHASAPT